MAELFELDYRGGVLEPELCERALQALEGGRVVFLPRLSFEVTGRERVFLDPATVHQPRRQHGRARLIFDAASKRSRHATVEGAERREMEAMVARFADWAQDLVLVLFPHYAPALQRGPTSFRPTDRTRRQGLHVDSFFFLPTQGRRVLRLFTNVNPGGRPRVWQLGEEPFEPFARRFLPRVRGAVPGSGWLLERARITRGRRTAYDHTMRQLRSLPKRDPGYRRSGTVIDFPSGSTWVVFTDGVVHGALAGQHAFEQTFLLPVDAMREPVRSPLRILERLLDRSLA